MTICCWRPSTPRSEYTALKDAGPIEQNYPIASTPLVTLVQEVAARPDVRSFHFIDAAAGRN